ncbi:Deoxyribose-phosphate aldolase [Phytophthora megakarya]|uniref:Deoxyribose-phosphate aldolase n=1 Tax=Phytophthora megakarya TaxID=4795 RepID=A0A225VMN7_9STRA|nr:Deoxyribose-phosphate aldolase [Phytophthora megakarya]
MDQTIAKHQPEPESKKASIDFDAKHEVKYRLKIAATDTIGKAISCVYRFFVVFCREESCSTDQKSKDKRTTNYHYFKTFRTDQFTQDLESTHKTKWEAYKLLSSQKEQVDLFTLSVPYQATL